MLRDGLLMLREGLLMLGEDDLPMLGDPIDLFMLGADCW